MKRTRALVVVAGALALVAVALRWGRRPRVPAAHPPASAESAPPAYRPVRRPTALDRASPLHLTPAARTAGRANRPSRVVVLGWDGASWQLALPLLRAGRLPNLESLMANGAYGNLDTIEPTYSTVIWTSIATGVPPSRHGVLDFVVRPYGRAISRLSPEERGQLHFYSNADRKALALWNLASDTGRGVLVVGYHNTYPAEPVRGLMVSSHLVREHEIAQFGVRSPSAGGGSPALVYPAGETRAVAAFFRPPSALRFEEISRFADLDGPTFARWQARAPRRPAARQRWDRLCRGYLYDEFHARVAHHYLPILKPALTMLHFQSVDWASHWFLGFHDHEPPAEGRTKAASPEVRQRRHSLYARTVAAFYEYLDGWLGRIQGGLDPDTAVVVLSDHGFEDGLDDDEQGMHDRAPPGIIVLAGPGIRAGTRIEGATLYDVLPTLAALLDLPIADDLPGRVLEAAFQPAWRQANPPRRVASYGPRPPQAQPDTPATLSRTLEEELRAVGYIR
jgi:hypothetical protein